MPDIIRRPNRSLETGVYSGFMPVKSHRKPHIDNPTGRLTPSVPGTDSRSRSSILSIAADRPDNSDDPKAFYGRLKLLDRSMCLFVWLVSLFRKSTLCEGRDRIGVIKLAAMGDALCLLPSLRELKKAYPGSKVTWLTTQRINPELFEGLPFVDEFFVITPSARGLLDLLSFLWNNPMDIAIDFDQYYLSSELIAYLWSRGDSVGYRTPLKGRSFALPIEYDPEKNEKLVFYDPVLALQGNLDKSASLYNEFSPYLPEIISGYIPSPNLQRLFGSIRKDTPVVAIYPGAGRGSLIRRWGIEKSIAVAKKCIEAGSVVIFLGGKDEGEYKEVLRREMSSCSGWHDLIGSCKLRDTAYVFSQVSAVISNDGGLLHFCDLLGAPCVSIFGPGMGIKWAPMAGGILVERNELNCKPCIIQYLAEISDVCKTGTRECLEGITPEEVFDACQELLKTSRLRH